MTDVDMESPAEAPPAEERLSETPKRKESTSSIDSHQTMVGVKETPASPRRSGIPPKRPTTAKRPISSAPTPATKPTASSAARTGSGNSLSKPPTRPTPGIAPRRPVHAVNAATAASPGHRARASMTSIEGGSKVRPDPTDDNKKPIVNGSAKKVTMAASASVRPPPLKSGLLPAEKRSKTGNASSSDDKPAISRSTVSRPATSAMKSTATSVSRNPTSSNSTRTTRFPTSSTNATKRLSTTSPPASVLELPSAAKPAQPVRPGLPARQSTLSVTIQQRLREMQLVSQMLSAAMAEDGDGNDEEKEEAARQADEGIAMLKAKLEKAKAEEVESDATTVEGGNVGEVDQTEPLAKEEDSHGAEDDEVKGHHDVTIAELQARLEESEANVSSLKAELEASQNRLSEASEVAQSVPQEVEEATTSLRKQHALEVDRLVEKHKAELDSLRTDLDEAQAKHQEFTEQRAKELGEAGELAVQEARTEAAKHLEQEKTSHAKALQDLEEMLGHEQQQNSSLGCKVQELTSTIAELDANFEEAALERGKLESGHAEILERKDREVHGKDQVIDNLKDELQKLQEAKEKEIEAADMASTKSSSNFQAELSKLKSELQEAKRGGEQTTIVHDESLKAKDEEIDILNKTLTALKEEMHTLSDNNKRDIETKARELGTQHENALGQLKSDHAAALESLTDKHAGVLKGKEDQIEEIRQRHAEEVKRLVEELDATRSELHNTLTDLTASKTDLEVQLQQMKNARAEDIQFEKDKRERIEREIDEMRSSHAAESRSEKEKRETLERELGEMRKFKAAELQSEKETREALERRLEEMQSSRATELQAEKEKRESLEHELETLSSSTTEVQLEKEKRQALERELEGVRSSNAAKVQLEQAKTKAMEQKLKELEQLQTSKSAELQFEKEKRETLERGLEEIKSANVENLQSEKERRESLEREVAEMRSSIAARLQAEKERRETLELELQEVRGSNAAELQSNQGRMQTLERELDELRSSNSVEVRSEKEKRETVERELEEMRISSKAVMKLEHDRKEALDRELDEVRRGDAAELDAAKQAAAVTESSLEEKLKAMENEAREARELSEDSKTALEAATQEIQNLKKVLETLKVEGGDKDKEHAAALEKLMAEADAASKRLRKGSQELQSATTEHNEELQSLRDQLTAKTTESEGSLSSKHQAAIDEIQARYDALLEDLEKTKKDHSAEIQAFQNKSLEDLQSLKVNHEQELNDVITADSNAAQREEDDAERATNCEAELQSQIDELQREVDSGNKEISTLKDKLQRAENVAERHALKLRELESAFKVTSAELTEMQTRRTNRADYCASPTTKSGLPLSKWATSTDGGVEDGKEGEELGSSIEGTMAGLQEQVRQLEEVNEDMLEETTRIVKMLSEVPERKASRSKISHDEETSSIQSPSHETVNN